MAAGRLFKAKAEWDECRFHTRKMIDGCRGLLGVARNEAGPG